MSRKKIGYKERIFDYLVENGSITAWEAIKEFGATRLSAIIFDLKKDGFEFEDEWVSTTNRYGEPVSYKRYELKNN